MWHCTETPDYLVNTNNIENRLSCTHKLSNENFSIDLDEQLLKHQDGGSNDDVEKLYKIISLQFQLLFSEQKRIKFMYLRRGYLDYENQYLHSHKFYVNKSKLLKQKIEKLKGELNNETL